MKIVPAMNIVVEQIDKLQTSWTLTRFSKFADFRVSCKKLSKDTTAYFENQGIFALMTSRNEDEFTYHFKVKP